MIAGNSVFPVKDVDPVAVFVVQEVHLLILVEVRANEGIAAFDVVAEIGEGSLAPDFELAI